MASNPWCAERAVDPVIACQAMDEGFSEFQADLIGARFKRDIVERAGSVAAAVRPGLRHLDGPKDLPDIEPAAERIAHAVVRGEHLVLCFDHDSDGVAAGSVLADGLIHCLGADAGRVHLYATNKLSEGYGVSDRFVDRVLAGGHPIDVLITADQGSQDGARVARLADHCIPTIVTDHHTCGTQIPKRAHAFVNPIRSDSRYPDPTIAGCHVAWLVLCAVRRRLIEHGIALDARPSMASLLELCVPGIQSDCVTLGRSLNNRAALIAGLARMNSPSARPFASALMAAARKDLGRALLSQDIAFTIAPRIAAPGRLSDAMPGVGLLRSRSPVEASRFAEILESENTARRAIQEEMLDEARSIAKALASRGDPVLIVASPTFHAGVNGIVAARLLREFGRPVICLGPKPGVDGVFTGSMRSLPGVDAKALLDAVGRTQGSPNTWGGHRAAAGLTVDQARLETFADAAKASMRTLCAGLRPAEQFTVDVAPRALDSLTVLDEIEALEPFGNEFEVPLFRGRFAIADAATMGRDHDHLRLTLSDGVRTYKAAWFGAGAHRESLPRSADVVYRLSRNVWRGSHRVDIHIEDIKEAA